MNVNLGDTFDRFIAELLKSGLYQSQSEVVREGLRLLKEREELRATRLAHLKSEIDKGLSDLDASAHQTHDEESLKKLFNDSKARGRQKLSNKKKRAA